MYTELKLHHVNSDALLLAYIERRLDFVLGRFGPRIGKVTARIRPASPDGITCRMTLNLHPFGLIECEATDTDAYAAIDRCAGRLARRCDSRCGRSRSSRMNRLSIRVPGTMPLAG